MKLNGGDKMTSEFYYIDEEYFNDNTNESIYYILDDIIFTSPKKADEYLVNHFEKNDFHSMREKYLGGDVYCFVMTDSSFPEKYDGLEGDNVEKLFFINRLKLFK